MTPSPPLLFLLKFHVVSSDHARWRARGTPFWPRRAKMKPSMTFVIQFHPRKIYETQNESKEACKSVCLFVCLFIFRVKRIKKSSTKFGNDHPLGTWVTSKWFLGWPSRGEKFMENSKNSHFLRSAQYKRKSGIFLRYICGSFWASFWKLFQGQPRWKSIHVLFLGGGNLDTFKWAERSETRQRAGWPAKF